MKNLFTYKGSTLNNAIIAVDRQDAIQHPQDERVMLDLSVNKSERER